MQKFMSFFALSVLFFACSPENTNQTIEQPKQKIQSDKTEVLTAKAQNTGFEHLIKVAGKAEADQAVQLRFLQAGLIEKIHFRNGQSVNENSLIASLNQTEWQLSEKKATAELANRSEDFKKLFLEFGGDLANPQKMTDTLMRSLQVRSGLRLAKVHLEEAQFRLKKTALLAPFSGVLANIVAKEGTLTDMQQPFCMLYNPNSICVVAEILQHEAMQLKIGHKATISTLYDRKNYTAVLQEINPFVGENGLVKVKLKITEKTDIFPGMNVRVLIHIPVNNRLTVPRDAVVNRSGRDVVFTVEKGLSKWNFVTIGLENGTDVEILEGLKAEDVVIITNNLQLAHDAEVSVVPQK